MTTDVLGYLKTKGINPKRGGGSEYHFPCPFCGEAENKRGRLYINTDPNARIPGLFTCFLCGAKGSLTKIRRHFGDPVTNAQDDRGATFYEVMSGAADLCAAELKNQPRAMEYLQDKRHLTQETIEKFKLGWANEQLVDDLLAKGFDKKALFDSGLLTQNGPFFRNVITIPYFAGSVCVGLREKQIGGKYKQPAGWTQRLFNSSVIYGIQARDVLEQTISDGSVILTEGEFDCMLATQLGFTSVGIPGANQFKDDWAADFDRFERVFVVFDNDDAGRVGARKIKEILGSKAKIANVDPAGPEEEYQDDGRDFTDFVTELTTQGLGTADIVQEIETHLRKSLNTGGLLVSVYDAWEEWADLQGTEGLKFNYEHLDHVIRPGLLPGQVLVLLAATSAGKTISTINLFHRMKMLQPEMKVLFISLEQTRSEWFERAMRIYSYYNLDIAPRDESPEELIRFRAEAVRRTLKFWDNSILLVDVNRITEDDLSATIRDAKDIMGGVDLVAVDYLGYYAYGVKGKDHYEQTSRAVMSIKAVAKDARIPIITPSQVNRTADPGVKPDLNMARSSGVVEETGDFVFSLWNPDRAKNKDPSERTGVIHMSAEKSRHGGAGELFKFRFAPMTLALVPIDDQAATLALNELNFPKDSWELALWRHRTGKRF